jgi:hypothetical protein
MHVFKRFFDNANSKTYSLAVKAFSLITGLNELLMNTCISWWCRLGLLYPEVLLHLLGRFFPSPLSFYPSSAPLHIIDYRRS